MLLSKDSDYIPPPGTTVLDRVAEQVRAVPDATAVIDDDGSIMTYAELWSRAEELAGRLPIVEGELVGVYNVRSIDFVVSLLAVVLADGIYVPLSPEDSEERTTALLDQVRIACIVEGRRESLGPRVRPGVDPQVLPLRRGHRDRPIYVMFTSGTTGTPKTVLVPHRGVLQLIDDEGFMQIGPSDKVAFASNQMFDAATWEIWVSLGRGASLAVVAQDDLLDASRLRATIARTGITCAALTTSLFNHLVRHDPDLFGSLESLSVGGEAMNPTQVRRVLGSGSPPRRLLNGYGPTECTTFATWCLVTEELAERSSVPIGLPFCRTTTMVVGDDGRELPAGEAGELWLGGEGVALGYLGDEKRTNERFPALPNGEGGVERWFRTGDLAFVDPAGMIICLGRIDRQVKISGKRIDLGEIEDVLGRCDGVAHVAVIAEPSLNPSRLAGFVVGSSPLDLRNLAEHLRRSFPSLVVPIELVEVPAIPLTRSGKLDTTAMLELLAAQGDGDEAMLPLDKQGDALEPFVVECTRSVLGLTVVGIDDDFTDLGLDSLAAVELVEMLVEGGYDGLSVSMLATASTPRLVADALRSWRLIMETDVVVLNATGTEVPWVCFPGAGGSALGFTALAEHVAEHPIMVIEPHGLHTSGPPDRTVEAAARRAISEISTAWPDGPLVLLGVSSGGAVAYDAAQRLVAAGREVAVVLCDTIFFLSSSSGRSQWRDPGTVLGRKGRLTKLAQLPLAHLRVRGGARNLAFYESMGKIQSWALARYRPRPPRFPVAIFTVASTQAPPSWLTASPMVSSFPAGGEHLTLMKEPFVADIAAAIIEWSAAGQRD